ncbi:DUF6105 family protein [Aurantimonas marina]|uniref:DUF6105 family protein n=1 Tax=Aurantimonas marina TaxID=2780508 RepID=UPI0019D03359|nr:DUF6105 family protein [Aurantimonas marina]
MRKLLALWLGPLAFFWGWYFLSLNDLGGVFFSRALHDQVFGMYGAMLGLDPAAIPGMIAEALVVDSLILGAIVAFRRRRKIAAWWERRRTSEPAALAGMAYARSDESLSSAP